VNLSVYCRSFDPQNKDGLACALALTMTKAAKSPPDLKKKLRTENRERRTGLDSKTSTKVINIIVTNPVESQLSYVSLIRANDIESTRCLKIGRYEKAWS